ncbi:30S ribosomal protein S3 [Candidatus Anstonella stagnisolia]|nr:30S ribosomal protein S3 [Candidatus Anstonella stagnisolia]
MGIEKKFIEDSISLYRVSQFLETELDRAGFSRVLIQRTPMVTRINVEVMNPGKVIGKKGKSIRDLTDAIANEFGIKDPQISASEVGNPSLEPRLMAKKACRFIEMGKKIRPILHSLLREIMENGALGAEIIASGKIAAKGGRSKSFRVFAGYIPKAGEPARLVLQNHVTAYPKSGAIGVLVRIVAPNTVFPDKVGKMKKIEIPKIIASAEDVENVAKRNEADEAKEEERKAIAEKQKRPHPQKR